MCGAQQPKISALVDEAFRPIVADIENALVGLVAGLLKRLKLDEASALTVYLGITVTVHSIIETAPDLAKKLTATRAWHGPQEVALTIAIAAVRQ